MSDDDLAQWWSAYDDPAGSAPPEDLWASALDTALDPATDVDFALFDAPAEVSGTTGDDADGVDTGLDADGAETGGFDDEPAVDTDLSVTIDDDPADGDDDWGTDTVEIDTDGDGFDPDSFDTGSFDALDDL